MITNFEIETCPLTSDELESVNIVCDALAIATNKSPIKSDRLCQKLNQQGLIKFRMTGVRLRKITNYIRSNGILPIIATSSGYFTSYDKSEIELQIRSLNERADAIRNSAEGLKAFLKWDTDLFGYLLK